MKILTINLSGNVGKTTSVRNLLYPRIKESEVFSVESANSDGQEDITIKGKKFNQLMQAIGIIDNAIVDVGASNAEDFLWGMKQFRGSHEDFDYFIVPTVGRSKQLSDTINTIKELSDIGVEPNRLKVVFNQVEYDDVITDIFEGIYRFKDSSKAFTICDKAVIHTNELYPLLVKNKLTISDVLSDTTDYKSALNESKSIEEKMHIMEVIGIRRLAEGVKEELDLVFKKLELS